MEDQISPAEGIITPQIDDNKYDSDSENQKKAGDSNERMAGEGLEEAEGEYVEGEHLEGDLVEREEEQVEEEYLGEEQKVLREGDQFIGEELEGEHTEGKEVDEQEIQYAEKQPAEVTVEEEERYVEEPPPDPTAPFNFSDSKEELREPFQLRPDQLAELEQLWDLYQNYTPAYTDIEKYITEKELVYMLKSILLMTITSEQLQELIDFCVRPPHPHGHITFQQFLRMVTIRQRDFLIEDELRSALQVFDPERTGTIDREYLKDVLLIQGHKMPQKPLDNLIKEVDMSNDGTIGIEDVVGTMCIDLNKEDLMMLIASVFSNAADRVPEENV
ncbi:caltractin ICL1d-like [Achroia grisella]|uniref:caltractin ICL1d-like n=1 Tax=Achroia grisella TaxID=688607 RepID=UPI0027D2A113|nr:caltractin ICL1d-like [Achroia grisella]